MNAQLKRIAKHFRAIEADVPLRPIRNESDYEKAVSALNRLLDGGAADESNELANLAATLGELIGDYDDKHYPRPEISGVAMLTFLMEQNGLKQADLPELGTQGVISEIISGKREMNIRHVRQLKARFGVSADVFV